MSAMYPFLLILFLSVTTSIFAKYELAIFSIFQNEAPYMVEWLEFHKLQGVEHFYLYNNKSTDNFRKVLEPYIKDKVVTLRDWSYSYEDGDHAAWITIQSDAYMDCIQLRKKEATWIAFIDLDEYLFCPSGEKLPSFLKSYTDYGGLCVNWQKFGTSNVEDIPDGYLFIERLTSCSNPQDKENRLFKSIVQPKHVKECQSAHHFIYKDDKFAVDANFAPMKNEFRRSNFTPKCDLDKIRINHYWTRTARDFREQGIPNRQKRRPNFTPERQMEMAEASNLFEDTSILQFVNPLRLALGLPERVNTCPAAVTYTQNPSGRFGDQLLAFSHALWFSYLMDLPLVYKHFIYSDMLALDDDSRLIKSWEYIPNKHHILRSADDYLDLFNNLYSSTHTDERLFVVPMYADSYYLFDGRPQPQFTEVNWKDPEFLSLLRSYIKPKKPLKTLKVPKDIPTVALHYRTGINFDKPNWQNKFPLKGPPDSFYVDALSHLSKIIDGRIYVYIFTDHPNPEEAKKTFRSYFPDPRIEFDCRKGLHAQDMNVLEDFFSLGEFDCLIRPESNFSILASILFPYKITITPHHHYFDDNNEIVVDQLFIEYAADNGIKQPIRTILRKD